MTIPLSLLQRAKQGDANAIAALMNDALQSQDIQVKVTLDGYCLQVMLKSPAVLNQATCTVFIQRGLRRLQTESITSVRAFAWRLGEAFPRWVAEFPAAPPSSHQEPLHGAMPVDVPAPVPMPVNDALSPSPSRSVTQPTASKSRSELFKLGFMVVLITMVYFVVAGA